VVQELDLVLFLDRLFSGFRFLRRDYLMSFFGFLLFPLGNLLHLCFHLRHLFRFLDNFIEFGLELLLFVTFFL